MTATVSSCYQCAIWVGSGECLGERQMGSAHLGSWSTSDLSQPEIVDSVWLFYIRQESCSTFLVLFVL